MGKSWSASSMKFKNGARLGEGMRWIEQAACHGLCGAGRWGRRDAGDVVAFDVQLLHAWGRHASSPLHHRRVAGRDLLCGALQSINRRGEVGYTSAVMRPEAGPVVGRHRRRSLRCEQLATDGEPDAEMETRSICQYRTLPSSAMASFASRSLGLRNRMNSASPRRWASRLL